MARPAPRLGLTAERAAHMMLENGWDSFGVPSVITSDQGSQFVGQWWRTMCARLGIRQAYSQAYRAQANGRAEVAGKALIGILRKLQVGGETNWVEALPRVLRMYHDTPGESGLSPYQILFGRDRNCAGVPYEPVRECEGARVFFDRMSKVDQLVAKVLNEKHEKDARRVNQSRTKPPPYQPQEWVWVLRPPNTGTKLETWWVGPMQVVRRVGDQSYQVEIRPGVMHDVHQDQMKPFVEDRVGGPKVDLYHHVTGYKALETQPDEWDVQKIMRHRRKPDGTWEFLTRWENTPAGEETWEPGASFVTRYCGEFAKYLRAHRLDLGLSEVLRAPPQ